MTSDGPREPRPPGGGPPTGSFPHSTGGFPWCPMNDPQSSITEFAYPIFQVGGNQLITNLNGLAGMARYDRRNICNHDAGGPTLLR